MGSVHTTCYRPLSPEGVVGAVPLELLMLCKGKTSYAQVSPTASPTTPRERYDTLHFIDEDAKGQKGRMTVQVAMGSSFRLTLLSIERTGTQLS